MDSWCPRALAIRSSDLSKVELLVSAAELGTRNSGCRHRSPFTTILVARTTSASL